jgi:two-component system CheB/CheR fusion protein
MKDAPTGKTVDSEFLIIGIGASAGGIKALKAFFSKVQANSGMAYVVILHLSPDFESRLAEILQKVTPIPVSQVQEDRIKVKPDHVYVIAPNKSLSMSDGHLSISSIESFEERRAPIDIFFRTLADSNDGRAVGVVLSGTGADGSMGMRRIKENGGIILVQQPEEAEYQDMPRNSIAQGLVDFILPSGEIPDQIIHYRNQRGNIHISVKREEETKEEEHESALKEIFTQLRIKTGHDFSNYKRATILRRIERRMNIRELPDLPSYAAFIHKDKEEPQVLLKELLISVTNFFRDRNAFEALEKQVLPRIFSNKGPDGVVRIWAPACATGEEAYSIAMLCAEQMNGMVTPPSVQIFATDIDSSALLVAREGLYTNADVADVSPDRLRKFFVKEGTGFRIRRELRETILFARHNILKDPPFSHLDFVSCRNLLIYLNRTAQNRVMETFHFALNPGGYLFLGSSETIDGNTNLYSTIDRQHCIFQSRSMIARPPFPVPEMTLSKNASELSELSNTSSDNWPAERLSIPGLHQQLLELYGPPSILINGQYDIMHVSKSAGRYLQLSGEPSLNLLSVIRPELRLELRSALYSAAQSNNIVHVPHLRTFISDQEEITTITVKPVNGELEAARGFMLVQFIKVEEDASSIPLTVNLENSEPIARQLEEELLRTRAQLRHTSEQYEVQTEEFKASNEELQAINEELRSAAEELETSKEELQSVNEELTTVNQELKIKIDELSQTNNDFRNLINATNIGTIFLDRTFCVNLFTPAACEIFNLKAADYGRPLSDITNHLLNTNISADIAQVLESLQPAEREVSTTEGRTYLMRILPYRTSEDHINGVVVTFVNITSRKKTEESLRSSEERLKALIHQARAGLAQTDLEGRFTMANQRYCHILGYTEEELKGKQLKDLVHPEDLEEYNSLFRQMVTKGHPFEAEQRFICKDGSSIWLHNSITSIRDNAGAVSSLLIISIDISIQKASEKQKDDFISIASHELKTPITSIKAFSEILRERFRISGDIDSETLVAKLDAQVDKMTHLVKDLLDTTRLIEGQLLLNKSTFSLEELVRETVEMLQFTAPKTKLELHLAKHPLYTGDRERISQVLVNLISNAIKYAPGTEKIIIRSMAENDRFIFSVQDFGRGISEDSLPRIFERFFRAEEAETSTYPGMGLGLYISAEIAKLHGGTIIAESSKGKGAIFRLILPLNY